MIERETSEDNGACVPVEKSTQWTEYERRSGGDGCVKDVLCIITDVKESIVLFEVRKE